MFFVVRRIEESKKQDKIINADSPKEAIQIAFDYLHSELQNDFDLVVKKRGESAYRSKDKKTLILCSQSISMVTKLQKQIQENN